MKRNKLIGLLSLCLLAATFASCEDWNETEAVKQKVERPEDQNPELWAEYTAALRDYKQSEHFIVYARLFNSPQPGTSEKVLESFFSYSFKVSIVSCKVEQSLDKHISKF